MVATSLVLDMAEAVEPRYRAMILLAGFAGLRAGEQLGLRRSDVGLLHGEVHVRRQAQEITGGVRMVLEPKSEAGRRTVALPSIVVAPSTSTSQRSPRPTLTLPCSPGRRAGRSAVRRSHGSGGRP